MVHNVYAILQGGRVAGYARKHHLPNYNVFDEPRVFRPGAIAGPFRVGALRFGTPICEDSWYPDVAEAMAESGAEILVVPNGSPFRRGKFDVRMHHMVARVVETGLPLAYVNMVGGQDDQVFDGGSFVLNPGRAAGGAAAGFRRGDRSTSTSRRPRRGGGRRRGRSRCIRVRSSRPIGRCAWGSATTCARPGFRGALLGLSGGVDSALVAAVAVDALGAENVRCVMLPSEFTSAPSLEDAAAVAGLLGCRLDELSIEPGRAAVMGTLAPLFAGRPPT